MLSGRKTFSQKILDKMVRLGPQFFAFHTKTVTFESKWKCMIRKVHYVSIRLCVYMPSFGEVFKIQINA